MSRGAGGETAELLGRSDELEQFSACLEEALGGRGSTLFVEGEAGIGKSRLLAGCVEIAMGTSAIVLQATASVLETERPFGVVSDALLGTRPSSMPAASTDLVGLLRGSSAHWPDVAGESPGARFRTVEAVVDDVERASLAAPLVLVVDDVQWADPSSTLALHALARRAGALPLLLLLAGRPPSAGSAYEQFAVALARSGARSLPLGPLGTTDVHRMAEQTLGAPPGENLRRKLDGAAGNPFYVTALLDGLRRDDVLHREGSEVDAQDPGLPPSLQLTILRGLQALDLDARDALRSGAVLGSGFSLSDLALVTNCSPLETWDRLEPAVAGGLLQVHGERLGFRHDLVREAIYADIPLPVRQELHRQTAGLLAEAGREPLAVAAHLLYGPPGPDPDGASWLRRAARDAGPRAPESATAFLRRAIEVLPPDAPERADTRAELLMALVWSARLDEAESLAAELLSASSDPRIAGTARLGMGWAYWVAGRTLDAASVFQDGAHDSSLSAADRARLAGFAAWIVGFQLGRTADAHVLARQAVEDGDRFGDDLAACMGGAGLAARTYFAGRTTDAITEVTGLIERVEASTNPELQRVAGHVLLALTLVEGDRIAEADEVLRRGREASEDAGAVSSLAIWHRTHALRHFAVGDWDDALAEADAGIVLASDAGTSLGSVAGLAIRALIAVRRGDLDGAERAIAAATATLRRNGPEYRSQWISWAAASLAEAGGAAPDALVLLAGMWEDCRRRGLPFELPWLGPDLVRLALHGGQRDLAASVTDAFEGFPDRGHLASVDAAALRCRGLLEADADMLLAAAERARAGPRRPMLAASLADAGAMLAAKGRAAEAKAPLEEAVTIFEELGADTDVRRVTSMLRGAGVRRGSRGTRGRPTSGWASLTPSEARVAELVAEGFTNAEIAERLYVSRRTVETHVARVLTKLGMRSRVQVVRAMATGPGPRGGEPSGR